MHLCPAALGNPVENAETGLVEFRLSGPLQYMSWYHAVGLIWISEFILACQQMTVAGAVVTYYFTRYTDRESTNQMALRPANEPQMRDIISCLALFFSVCHILLDFLMRFL